MLMRNDRVFVERCGSLTLNDGDWVKPKRYGKAIEVLAQLYGVLRAMESGKIVLSPAERVELHRRIEWHLGKEVCDKLENVVDDATEQAA